jgi:hypothetical protein
VNVLAANAVADPSEYEFGGNGDLFSAMVELTTTTRSPSMTPARPRASAIGAYPVAGDRAVDDLDIIAAYHPGDKSAAYASYRAVDNGDRVADDGARAISPTDSTPCCGVARCSGRQGRSISCLTPLDGDAAGTAVQPIAVDHQVVGDDQRRRRQHDRAAAQVVGEGDGVEARAVVGEPGSPRAATRRRRSHRPRRRAW